MTGPLNVAGDVIETRVRHTGGRSAGHRRREPRDSEVKVCSGEVLEIRGIRTAPAVDAATSDIEFIVNQRVQAEARVINAAARRFLPQETRKLRHRTAVIDVQADSGRDHAVLAEATETLNEGPVKNADLPISA